MGHIRSQETVDSALKLSDLGVTDRENAAIHGVAVKTIRRWRRLYQRRGLPRGGAYESRCPRCDGADLERAAYSPLLGWYLGDGHIAAARRGVFVLSSSNDPKYPKLNDESAETMLEDWRREIVAEHPGALLRGLFHSDGCRITNWTVRVVAGERKRYEYLLGIAWRARRNMVAVSRREAVAALDEFVGPKS